MALNFAWLYSSLAKELLQSKDHRSSATNKLSDFNEFLFDFRKPWVTGLKNGNNYYLTGVAARIE